jgi:hypothetical protein
MPKPDLKKKRHMQTRLLTAKYPNWLTNNKH